VDSLTIGLEFRPAIQKYQKVDDTSKLFEFCYCDYNTMKFTICKYDRIIITQYRML